MAHTSAEIIDARNFSRASAAHNTCFMYVSPDVGKNGCAALNCGGKYR
jgi:hypothetical protein